MSFLLFSMFLKKIVFEKHFVVVYTRFPKVFWETVRLTVYTVKHVLSYTLNFFFLKRIKVFLKGLGIGFTSLKLKLKYISRKLKFIKKTYVY